MNKYTPEQVEAMADAYFQDTEDVDQCGAMLRAYAATLRQQAERVDEVERIHIRWDAETATYKVSKPNWNGGEVVMATDYEAALAQSAQGEVVGYCKPRDMERLSKIRGEPAHNFASVMVVNRQGADGYTVPLYTHPERARVPDEFFTDLRKAKSAADRSRKINRLRVYGRVVERHIESLLAAPSQPKESEQ